MMIKINPLHLLTACAVSLAAFTSPLAVAQGSASASQCGPNTDPRACRQEAAAVRLEEKRGRLTSPGNYDANAVLRCERLPDDQRESCRKRVTQGKTSGTVEGGGTLTELREIVPVKP